MGFSKTKRGEVVTIVVDDQLVSSNRQELKRLVLDEVDHGTRRVVIDFARAGYIDSAGLGMLVSLSRQVRDREGELRLTNVHEDLKSLLELTKLDVLFAGPDPESRGQST